MGNDRVERGGGRRGGKGGGGGSSPGVQSETAQL